jgi:catalase
MKISNHSAVSSLVLLAGLFSLTPQLARADSDPNTMVNQFEATGGKFEGFRRSGAKGICATGEFIGSAEGRKISTASAFSGKPIPVVVRFSVGGANPKAADNAKTQRNLALQFNLPAGEIWQMGNISAPVFGSSTPEQLLGRLQSLQPDSTTKVADPVKVKAFADANPEVLIQGRYFAAQAVPASYVATNYWGVHGFGFSNAKKEKVWGKWVFEPGDNLINATAPLPEGRKKVTLGVLKIVSVSADGSGACLNITFDPNIMPTGVEGAADPMLRARTAPYAISLGRRISEGSKQQ